MTYKFEKGFKVGDKVRIVQAVLSGHKGWGNVWNDKYMDPYVGGQAVYTIDYINDVNGNIHLAGISCSWHEDCLELYQPSYAAMTLGPVTKGPLAQPERELTAEEKLIEYRRSVRRMLGGS